MSQVRCVIIPFHLSHTFPPSITFKFKAVFLNLRSVDNYQFKVTLILVCTYVLILVCLWRVRSVCSGFDCDRSSLPCWQACSLSELDVKISAVKAALLKRMGEFGPVEYDTECPL